MTILLSASPCNILSTLLFLVKSKTGLFRWIVIALIQSWAILCPALDIDSVIRLRCLIFLRRDTVEVVNVIIITVIRVAHIILIQYAISLKETIRTVIIGAEKVLPEGSEYLDMSLLSLVADTIMVCSNTNDWDWQVMSPLMIPGLFPHKDYVTKNDLVLWAQSNNFPLDDTYSCTSGNEECFLCKNCMAKKRIIQ